MVAFEIYVNGKRICTAGVDAPIGVLSAALNWVRRRPAVGADDAEPKGSEEDLTLSVAGHTNRPQGDFENLEWLKETLSPGDEVTIRILQADCADPPARRRRSAPGAGDRRRFASTVSSARPTRR